MSYSLVSSVADHRDLLDEVSSFAVSDGWTLEYDNASSTNKQIALSKDACHLALGEINGENPIDVSGSVDDARIYGSLATSINTGNVQFWGHPGSPVTASTDGDRIRINDLLGPMANVWLFSGDGFGVDYIHVVAQTYGDRYHHFSFGVVDALGMTTPNVGYAWGMYYNWWPDGTNPANPTAAFHEYAFLGREPGCHINMPSGVLPAGYPSAGVYVGGTYLTLAMTVVTVDSGHYTSAPGKQLDFFLPLANQLTTGGTPLFSLPVLFRDAASATSHVWIGNFPGVKLVDIADHTPGSTLTYGSEEWVVFPWKRKGLRENLSTGSSPLPNEANTIEYGLAYKKNA